MELIPLQKTQTLAIRAQIMQNATMIRLTLTLATGDNLLTLRLSINAYIQLLAQVGITIPAWLSEDTMESCAINAYTITLIQNVNSQERRNTSVLDVLRLFKIWEPIWWYSLQIRSTYSSSLLHIIGIWSKRKKIRFSFGYSPHTLR